MELHGDKAINKRVIIFLLMITPFIDLFNGFFDMILESTFSPGLFIRSAILLIIFYIYGTQKKGNILRLVGIISIFAIQMGYYMFTYDISILSEGSFISKIYYNLFLMFIFNDYFINSNDDVEEYVETLINVGVIITLSLIITKILGVGEAAYGVGEGYKGLYIGLNDLTAVLSISFVFIVYRLVKSNYEKKYLLYSGLVGLNILTIGTKTSIVMVGITIVFFILNELVRNRRRSNVVIMLVGVSIFLLVFRVFMWESFLHIISRQKHFFEKLDLVSYILSGRNFTLGNAMEYWVSNPINWVLGLGFSEGSRFIGTFLKGHGMIEMDLMDILYFYGIPFFIIVACPIVKKLVRAVKSIFSFDDILETTISLVFILVIAISFLGGHILLSPFAGVYFALIFGLVGNVNRNKGVELSDIIIDSRTKVYQIGPDISLKGGIATVIRDINSSELINSKFNIVLIGTMADKRIRTYAKAFLQVLDIEKGSIIHFHVASNGSFIRKYILYKVVRKDTKKIFHLHGGDFINFYKKSNKFIKACITDMLNGCDRIINVSEFMLKDMKSEFPEMSSKMKRIYNGIEISNDNIDFIKKENKISYIGKLIDYKGIYDFIEILSNIKTKLIERKWKVIIAGDGEIEQVTAKIKKTGLDDFVEVIGWVDGKRKEELLRTSKIVVVPSHIESFGISAVEAMSYGNAVIATNVGALPEVIKENENGYIISKGDLNAFGEKIKYLVDDELVIEKISENNVEYARKFTLEEMFGRLVTEYEAL